MGKRTKKSKKKKIIPPEEKERRSHIKEIRTIFSNAGFYRIAELSDKEFVFKGRKSDFDDIYIYENVITMVREESGRQSGVTS